MPRLTIKLFGTPHIEIDGVTLSLDGRIPIALLAYLAMTGQTHTRDALATLFWPESAKARAYLRNNLWIINEALGAWVKGGLHSDHETLGFESQAAVWLDTAHFTSELAVCRTHDHPEYEVCVACLTHLHEALRLYRNDFLAGFTLRNSPGFDEWQFFQRERLRRELFSVLERLVRYHTAQGEYGAAIGHARHWLTLDHTHEPTHRYLMQLYAWSGQPAAALRQYQECVRVLAAELDVSPDPDTNALYEQIRTRQFSDRVTGWQGSNEQAAKGKELPSAIHELQPTIPQHPHNNLLTQLTPLVGRHQERETVQARLRRAGVRLLTLTGPGGVGKTRLALQVAADLLADFTAGTFFVPLAPIREATLVISAIAQILGVREIRGQSLAESVVAYLRDKEILLVLDNFEHVMPAAPLVTQLLAACSQLKILVTSRAVLHLYGEHEFAVPSLATPVPKQSPSFATLSQYEAVQLFIQRAQAVRPDFVVDNANAPALAEICVRLDGLPLALELAAARIKFFSPQALLRKLSLSTLEVLNGGAHDLPDRHKTLRRAIAWSYDLLSTHEQKLFRCLGVFTGGFTLEASGEVCTDGADVALDVLAGLISLVDKSLVRQEIQSNGESRFVLLETIREYALDCLKAKNELYPLQRRHALYYLALAEEANSHIWQRNQDRWLEKLDIEHDNLRSAFYWATSQGEVEIGLRLGSTLAYYWLICNHASEAYIHLTTLLQAVQQDKPLPWLGDVIYYLGHFAEYRGDHQASHAYFEQAVEVCRKTGNEVRLSYALTLLGDRAYEAGDYVRADELHGEGFQLSCKLGDTWAIGMCLSHQGRQKALRGDIGGGRAMCEEGLALLRAIGEKWSLAVSLICSGIVAHLQGNLPEARALFEESLQFGQVLGNIGTMGVAAHNLGSVMLEHGDLAGAQALLQNAIKMLAQLGYYKELASTLDVYAHLALAQNEPLRSLAIAGATATLRARLGLVLPPVFQAQLAALLACAQQMVNEEAATAAWAAGEAMTLEQTVAYALAEPAGTGGAGVAAMPRWPEIVLNHSPSRRYRLAL